MNEMTQTKERPAAATQRTAAAWVAPRADICETQDAYLVKLEMPGVGKEGLEISVENNELTVIGRRSDPQFGEPVHREIRRISYRRVFDLDPLIDATKISAKINQGIVTVTLPKAESLKPMRIPVSD